MLIFDNVGSLPALYNGKSSEHGSTVGEKVMKISKRTRRDLRIIEARLNVSCMQKTSRLSLGGFSFKKNVSSLFPPRLATAFLSFLNQL
jgi:hypothetical protein